MNDRRRQGQRGNRKPGWDNEEFRRQETRREAVREPYDPSKEVIVGEEGRIPLDRKGYSYLVLEYVSYNGGERQLRLVKTGTNKDGETFRTTNTGKLWGDQAIELSKMLASAGEKLMAEKAGKNTHVREDRTAVGQ